MIEKIDPRRRYKRRLLQAVLLSLSSSFLACGSNQVQQANPVVTPTPLVQSEVLIMPLGQKTKDELSYWTTENQRLVLAYFDIFMRHGFDQKTTSSVIVTEDSFETEALELAFENVEEEEGSQWWSFVPLSGRVAHNGRYPDYVLIFDGLRFRILSGAGSRQTYDVPGGGRVVVDLEYVLWDNRNQEVAASGRLHEESLTSSPHPSSDLFKDLFAKMAEEIVRISPLTQ